MTVLERLLRRPASPTPTGGIQVGGCTHGALAPRWHDPADLGREEKATSYTCESCGDTFTPAEAHRLQAERKERLQRV